MKYETRSAQETQQLATKIASEIEAGSVILINGELGAGKTTFVKGFIQGLGGKESEAKSPTFIIMREIDLPKVKLLHLDLYRLEDEDNNLMMEIEEKINEPNTITIIEWAERMPKLEQYSSMAIDIDYMDLNTRLISITTPSSSN